MKKTKIICTIGPASESPETLKKMVQAGMNVTRLNFSHGTHESHASMIGSIRAVATELALPIAIMQDLQGPKVRIGLLEKPLPVAKGQEVVIGKDFQIDVDIFDSVSVGERILIEDGRIELSVTAKSDATKDGSRLITCTTVTGGLIQSHKGVNIPDSTIRFPVITEKDIDDLHFGLDHDVDAVAVSFVRNKKDIDAVHDIIKKHQATSGSQPSCTPLIIAKIEKKEAIEKLDEIIASVDGIMVARGDLGVEIAEEEITLLQKKIVEKCRQAGKPVIVATQMLESMTTNPKPTRAEVSDVSNAVIDGVDCVMLSEETATGSYPVEAVTEMAAIVTTVEGSTFAQHISQVLSEMEIGKTHMSPELVAAKVGSFAEAVEYSRREQSQPLTVDVDNQKLLNQLSFIWGISGTLSR